MAKCIGLIIAPVLHLRREGRANVCKEQSFVDEVVLFDVIFDEAGERLKCGGDWHSLKQGLKPRRYKRSELVKTLPPRAPKMFDEFARKTDFLK